MSRESNWDDVVKALLDNLGRGCELNSGGASIRPGFIKKNKLIAACGKMCADDSAVFRDMCKRQVAKRKANESALVSINEHFSRAGVDYAIVKGASFEEAIYGTQPVRDVGDIDILVKSEDSTMAHRALVGMGYMQQFGPSSGSLNLDNKAFFVAKVSQQKHFVAVNPLRRFPFKDSYCPYTKERWPTVELHDGFRGLPEWYTNEVVNRAGKNEKRLVQDAMDVLILLLVNTYENSESFYSNYFDDKLVLRDFVDLACLLLFRKEDFDWRMVKSAIDSLEIVDKVGRVLNDLDDLLPGRFESSFGWIPRMQSRWNLCFEERCLNPERRRGAVLRVLRRDMAELAFKSEIGIRTMDPAKGDMDWNAGGLPSLELMRVGGEVDFVFRVGLLSGDMLVVACVFAVDGVDSPLCMRIAARLEGDGVGAFLRDFDKLPDGLFVWKESGLRLSSKYENGILRVRVPCAEAQKMLYARKVAITSCMYDRHYGDAYWTCCRGKATLAGDVPIGFMSLFSDRAIGVVCISFSFGKYTVSSETADLLDAIRLLFENSEFGVPVDCDYGVVRSVVVSCRNPDGYDVRIDGAFVAVDIAVDQALSLVMQDAMDWCVREMSKNTLLVHAASNLVGDGAVLLMGSSGKGKTTLSLSLAKFWPIRCDECACVDMENARTWAEPLPVNLKSNNEIADSLTKASEGIDCFTSDGRKTRYYSRDAFRADPAPKDEKRILAVVFPSYDRDCQVVETKELEGDGLVEGVLQSLIGANAPSENFRDFVQMVSRNNITLLRVNYSSAELAANYLVRYFQNGGVRGELQAG